MSNPFSKHDTSWLNLTSSHWQLVHSKAMFYFVSRFPVVQVLRNLRLQEFLAVLRYLCGEYRNLNHFLTLSPTTSALNTWPLIQRWQILPPRQETFILVKYRLFVQNPIRNRTHGRGLCCWKCIASLPFYGFARFCSPQRNGVVVAFFCNATTIKWGNIDTFGFAIVAWNRCCLHNSCDAKTDGFWRRVEVCGQKPPVLFCS